MGRVSLWLLAAPLCVTLLTASSGWASASSSSKPTPPIKTIGYVDVAATDGVEPQIYAAFQAGAAKLGWTTKLADAQDSPTTALQATQTFIEEGVNAIVFSSVPSSFVASALPEAKQKGIPTINIVVPSQGTAYDGQVAGIQTVASLQPLLASMKANLGAGAAIGAVEPAVILEGSPQAIVFNKAAKAAGFKVDDIVYPSITNVTLSIEQSVTSMLHANPGIKGVVDLSGLNSSDISGFHDARDTTVKLFGFNVDSATVPSMLGANSQVVSTCYQGFGTVAGTALNELLNHFGPNHTAIPKYVAVAKCTLFTAKNLPPAIKANPDGNMAPISPAKQVAPFVTIWSQHWTLG